MMEYDVLWDPNINHLIKEVNEAIIKGWTPLGGIAPDKAAFYQAMVREVKRKKT